ncbi:Holliday junction branch migration protein RuvA [Fodinicola acaciae]|uniref:Holliday junction branch migration protein RuvA n=1 Tax=Fodinicola acaciae TaxID=2681555 RepID=UPI0013CF424F|nr:Holliday junction branch migration protein RuvA [Fodinicola acaciae]
MITSVSGTVARIGADRAVVEVGGVGLELHCTPRALAGLRTGGQGKVATSLVVREDSLTLYGFTDEDERDLFELLQTANGVGPALARTILSVLSPDEVRRAISTGDVATLTRVPRVGRKGAEKLIVELRDKIGAIVTSSPNGTSAASAMSEAPWRTQVRAGLISLGFTGKDIDGAIDAVAPADGSDPDVSQALRGAIQRLGRK